MILTVDESEAALGVSEGSLPRRLRPVPAERGGMRDLRDETNVRAEPDIIVLGPDESGLPPGPDVDSLVRGGRAPLRRLRRFVEPSLLVLCAGVVFSVLYVMDERGSPTTAPAASPSSPASAAASTAWASARRPQLLAPETAKPGERLTVLAFRNRRLCGAAELRLDGAPVVHRLARHVGPLDSDWMEIFMTLDLPRSAAPGRHEIELYGPMRGGPRGPICGDSREHQGRFAARIVTVAPGQ
jgi:hypothetical protein